MGAGMAYHLKENELIREVFELGEPLPDLQDGSNLKPSKQERVSKPLLDHNSHLMTCEAAQLLFPVCLIVFAGTYIGISFSMFFPEFSASTSFEMENSNPGEKSW